jgi:hypothetical protein
LGHLLLGSFSLGTEPICSEIIPENAIADLGGKVVLKCRQASQNVAWTLCPKDGGKPIVIASGCSIVPSEVGRYRLDKANYGCDLVIDNVTASHLGTYTCQDLTKTDHGHSAELGNANENLALNKNTIQGSTLNAAYSSNYAVDGSYAQVNYAHSAGAGKEWWAVDLGQETAVGRVRITARSDAVRLTNIIIGLTNVSPFITKPDLAKSSICVYYHGYPAADIQTDIYCNANTKAGRYMFIQQTLNDYLILIEVEAYYH